MAERPRGAGAGRTIEVAGRTLPLDIRKLRHARRITLRLAPGGGAVRVSLPPWGRVAEAERFARERADWLARRLAELPEPATVQAGATVPYRGRALSLSWDPSAPRNPRLVEEARLLAGGPSDAFAARVQRWLEREALRLAGEDLADYCRRAGEAAPRLALSRAQRRWGSCSAQGVIRINWRLVMAPDAVRRSVVAHEVAHLAHFDHGPGFHRALAELYEGDQAAADAWLRREGRGLYRWFG